MRSDYLTVGEAAAFLRLSVDRLAKYRVHGGGPVFIKMGSRVVYDRKDLVAWVEGNKHDNTGTCK